MGPLVDTPEYLCLPLPCLDGLDIKEDVEALRFKRLLNSPCEVLAETLATMAEEYGAGAHAGRVSGK